MAETEPDDFVTVRTLLPIVPLPSNDARPTLTTDRLLLRPFKPTDLHASHALRTQEEVMKWSKRGRIDQSVDETREKIVPFLAPNDAVTATCAICLKSTGEFIGSGGCHLYPGRHGWPEMGYLLRKEFWGQGLATEFLKGWLQFWEELPRSEREVKVQREMVAGEGVVKEHLIAITEARNVQSQKVLLKVGFERFQEFTEADSAKNVQLLAFRYFPRSNRRPSDGCDFD